MVGCHLLSLVKRDWSIFPGSVNGCAITEDSLLFFAVVEDFAHTHYTLPMLTSNHTSVDHLHLSFDWHARPDTLLCQPSHHGGR